MNIKGKNMSGKSNQLRPIIFDSGAINWIVEDKNDTDKAYNVAKEKCFAAHDNTCAFCGYKANKTHTKKCGLEIFSLDGNGENINPENLVPACPYCRMCFNLSYAEEEGAVLVWLPELEQHEISFFYRIYFSIKHKKEDLEKISSRANQGGSNPIPDIYNMAEKVNAEILGRMYFAEQIIGTSKPGELGRVIESLKKTMQESSEVQDLFKDGIEAGVGANGERYKEVKNDGKNEDKHGQAYRHRAKIFDGIRLIPRKIAFNPALVANHTTNYRGLTTNWISRATNILKNEQKDS